MTTSTAAASHPQADSWERSRQCAEQAQRIARRNGWIEGGKTGSIRLMGWSNHYSGTFQRCFVRVSYFDEEARTNRALPLITYSLFDAFENNEIAICTDSVNAAAAYGCHVMEPGAESSSDCRACQRFVNERMTK